MGRNYFNAPLFAFSPLFNNIQAYATTGLELMAYIVNLLVTVGWTKTASFSNGVTMQADSPQLGMGLSVYLTILGYPDYCTMQFNKTETGALHVLSCPGDYVITAGNCQVVVHQPFYTNLPAGSVCMGGIPYIQPTGPGAPDLPLPTEVWWSVGDYYNGFGTGNTFRDQIGYMDAYGAVRNWCGFYTPTPNTQPTPKPLVMPGQGAAIQVEQLSFNGCNATQAMYPPGNIYGVVPYLYEPLISWGDFAFTTSDYTNYPPKVRGQMWDSYISTGPQYFDTYIDGPGPQDGVVLSGLGKTAWINLTVGAFNNGGINLRWNLWSYPPLGNYAR